MTGGALEAFLLPWGVGVAVEDYQVCLLAADALVVCVGLL